MVNQDKFINQDIDELAKRYRLECLGYIATGYLKEQEEAVYMAASKIIASKYNNLTTVDELYNKMKSRGHIFTIYKYSGDRRNGLYDGKTGNILIPYFIKRMSENLLHELTHKAGFINADSTFLYMNPDIRECGTEIVASSSFSVKKAKDAVLLNVWGKYPENASSELLVYSLVNQLNLLLGGQNLEKSILYGHDYFKEAIEKKYGTKFFEYITLQIPLITMKKNNLYSRYEELGLENIKLLPVTKNFFGEVKKFEDTILQKEFDIRFKNINSLETGKRFLQQLNEFGENRLQEENEDGVLEDSNLEEIFNDYKSRIEQVYGKTGIDYKKAKIEDLPILEIEEDLEPGEYDRIKEMARKFEITSRDRLKKTHRSKIGKLLERIIGNSKQEKQLQMLPDGDSNFYKGIDVNSLDGNLDRTDNNGNPKPMKEKEEKEKG